MRILLLLIDGNNAKSRVKIVHLEIGYKMETYEHRPYREFRGMRGSAFFYDRLGLLEKYCESYAGQLRERDIRKVPDHLQFKIHADEERRAVFEIPDEGTVTLVDYSFDCQYGGCTYQGRISFNLSESEFSRGILQLCRLLFPENAEILQYISLYQETNRMEKNDR